MNVISYRGPNAGGGVSAALSRLYRKSDDIDLVWWHIQNEVLQKKTSMLDQAVRNLPLSMVKGHYRYCNEFLWPILHDLPEFSRFSQIDKLHYEKLNWNIGQEVIRSARSIEHETFFVNDFQFALLPSALNTYTMPDVHVFWHIPWPKNVSEEHVPHLVDIAQGLLSAARVGFHIDEYADNFLDFVSTYLPGYIVQRHQRIVFKAKTRSYKRRETRVIVQPIGLDTQFWANSARNTFVEPNIWKHLSEPYVLSIDRGDYTKGVLERFDAIDRFFEMNREYVGKICFLQLCQQSRAGLPAFDDYWEACLNRAELVQRRWGRVDWTPVSWISTSISRPMLTQFYRNAAAMLINPLRDGFNLVAKEFAFCVGHHDNPGALILSPGAGAWQQLGDYSIAVQPDDPVSMAEGIRHALEMPLVERRRLASALSRQANQNTLDDWWNAVAASRADSDVMLVADEFVS